MNTTFPTLQGFDSLLLLFNYVPVLCVIVGGTILALSRWQSHARPALLTLLAMGLLLVSAVGQPLTLTLGMSGGKPMDRERLHAIMLFSSVVFGVVRAASYALLLAAIFSGRRPDQSPTPDAYLPPTRTL